MQNPNSKDIVPEEDPNQIQEENGVSDEEENLEEALETSELLKLETQFQATPNAEIATQLIQIYRDLSNPENVKRIRDTLLENAVLNEEQWLDYLNFEFTNAQTEEEKKEVLKLCERALEECSYLEVGQLLADYAETLFKEKVLRKRGVEIYLEKLISHFCNDFNNGSVFFEKLRNFLEKNAEKKDDTLKKQIRALYIRELKLPFVSIMTTWQSYQSWETDEAELKKAQAIYDETYDGIVDYLDLDEKFTKVLESKKSSDIVDVLETIMSKEYLTVERKLNYFSRCFDDGQGTPEIWNQYIDFAKANIKSNVGLEKIYFRAYKNNSNNINIALCLLRVMEKSGSEIVTIEKKIFGMFTKFTNIHEFYLLWLYLYEANSRLINKKLAENKYNLEPLSAEVHHFREFAQKGLDFFASFDPDQALNYISTLQLFWANLETYTFKDKQHMNQIMEKYIHSNGSSFHAWNTYITFEQVFGKTGAVRALIKRLIEVCKEDFHTLFNFAIEFERKFGSLEELEAIEQKYKEKIAKNTQPVVIVADDLTIREDIPELRNNQKNDGPKKRKYDDHLKTVSDNAEDQRDLKHLKTDLRKPVFIDKKNTVFVKNLPFSFTEPDIKALFGNANAITSVRVVRDKATGMAKGLAYVDFDSEEAAQEALTTNGILVDGRKLFVALSDPPKKGKQDDRTIFINNMAFSTDEQKIRDYFSDFARDIEDVRVVKDNQGAGKGFAYLTLTSNVNFFNKVTIKEKALELMDKHKNVNIDNRKVSLQLADSSKHFEQVAKASLVIFIKKLSKDVVEKDLEDFFKDYKVRQIHLVRDKETKKSKCFGFVEFSDLYNFKRALDLQNPKIHGQEIQISKSDRPITQDMDDDQKTGPAKKKNALSKKDAIIEEPQPEPVKEEPKDKNNLKKINFVPAQSSKPVITVVKKAEKAELTPEQIAKEARDKEAMPAPKSQNQFRALLKKN